MRSLVSCVLGGAFGAVVLTASNIALAAYPAPWPSELGIGGVGQWLPLTHLETEVGDTSGSLDGSTGGTTPGGENDIIGGDSVPKEYSTFVHYDSVNDVFMLRMRLAGNPMASGVWHGGVSTFSAGDPLAGIEWYVTIDIDGDGWQEFVIGAHGSALDVESEVTATGFSNFGTTMHAGDDLIVLYNSISPANQGIEKHSTNAQGEITAINELVWVGETMTQTYAGDGLNGQNYLDGFHWNAGATQVSVYTGDSGIVDAAGNPEVSVGNETLWNSTTDPVWFLDFQVPMTAFVDEAGVQKLDESRPISIGFSTSTGANPYQKDLAYEGTFTASVTERYPFSDNFTASGGFSQSPIITGVAFSDCAADFTVTASVQDTLSVSAGVVVDTVATVEFFATTTPEDSLSWSQFATDSDGTDGGTGFASWTGAYSGSLDTDVYFKMVATDDQGHLGTALVGYHIEAGNCYSLQTVFSFGDAAYSSPSDSFPINTTAYFSGFGYTGGSDYKLVFYDAAGAELPGLTTASSARADGGLAANATLSGSTNYGTWHVQVFAAATNPPATYSAAAGLAGHGFTVTEPDSDGDGVTDSNDCAPADATKWQDITGYVDADGDGVGTGTPSSICSGASLPAGYASTGGDCDDNASSCSASCADADSDGTPDCADGCVDRDSDGFGPSGISGVCSGSSCDAAACGNGSSDCNDNASTCGTVCTDVDSDGTDDCGDGCVDQDADGYGPTGISGTCVGSACDAAACGNGTTDCAPTDSSKWQDLSGFVDADGDSAGTGVSANVCSGATLPPGYATTGGDCDDNASTCLATCDDADGDGTSDCADACVDRDADGYGPTGISGTCTGSSCDTAACSGGSTDCDDNASTCAASCDDSDSDGTPDCADGCVDLDTDGYGPTGIAGVCSGSVCDAAACVAGTSDCAPADSSKWQDLTAYTDGDGDGVGTGAGEAICSGASLPPGYVTIGGDCDDNASSCSSACTDDDADGTPDCADSCVDVNGDEFGLDGISGTCTGSTCSTEVCAAGTCTMGTGSPADCDIGDADGDGTSDAVDLDDDNDGILDSEEGTADTDGDGIPDSLDLDSDDDGIPDAVEAGHHLSDGDGDGRIDCASGVGANGICDDLETVPDDGAPDYDGDGTPDDVPADLDADGVPDYRDLDSDNDGLCDAVEAGHALGDDDGDCIIDCAAGVGVNGICDDLEVTPDAGGVDFDGDGSPNSEPIDTDGDGQPDFRDLDADGDGISDLEEGGRTCSANDAGDACIGTDSDGDGIVDDIDDADDGFGTTTSGSHHTDFDNDGTPDFQDLDSDNDGLTDVDEVTIYGSDPRNPDTDGGGLLDSEDVALGRDPNDSRDDQLGVSGGRLFGWGCQSLTPDSNLLVVLAGAWLLIRSVTRRRREENR